MIWIYKYQSPLGAVTMAARGNALIGLWFDGQKYFGATLTEDCEEKQLPVFHEAERWLNTYFKGVLPDFMPPIETGGTNFQREVWDILKTIPYGKTMTYGQIGAEIAKRRGLSSMSAQAVGSAVGRNPISILIPCHRVVGADGSLTGYAGGREKKRALLTLEKAM